MWRQEDDFLALKAGCVVEKTEQPVVFFAKRVRQEVLCELVLLNTLVELVFCEAQHRDGLVRRGQRLSARREPHEVTAELEREESVSFGGTQFVKTKKGSFLRTQQLCAPTPIAGRLDLAQKAEQGLRHLVVPFRRNQCRVKHGLSR